MATHLRRTVSEFGKGVFEVKTTIGDAKLGGTDMNQALYEHLAEQGGRPLWDGNGRDSDYAVSVGLGRVQGSNLTAKTRRCAAEAKLMDAHWEHFAHGADIGVRGFGATEAEAFEQAGLALTAVIADLATVEPREAVAVECDAPDDELLFAEWLNGLIYEMAIRKMLFARYQVRLAGGRLSARAWGERIDVVRHHPAVEVKGATYTQLRVAREADGWVAQTVVDV